MRSRRIAPTANRSVVGIIVYQEFSSSPNTAGDGSSTTWDMARRHAVQPAVPHPHHSEERLPAPPDSMSAQARQQ